MIAYVFSGQGAQKAGMGTELARHYPAAAAVYEQASAHVGYDILELDDQQLAQTSYAQIALVTMSLAAWQAWNAESPLMSDPHVFAGFSLGEYSVLAAAGILDFTDLLNLVMLRAKLMQQASDENPGSMYAVIGLDAQKLNGVIRQNNWQDQVWLANDNAPGQIVIAGAENAARACADQLKSVGARRIVKLNVSGAFHTSMMRHAADQLAEYAAGLSFHQPRMSVYANPTGDTLGSDTDWPAYLARQMSEPVRWVDEVKAIKAQGADTFIELGPGRILTGLIRKILPGQLVLPVEDQAGLIAALKETEPAAV